MATVPKIIPTKIPGLKVTIPWETPIVESSATTAEAVQVPASTEQQTPLIKALRLALQALPETWQQYLLY